MSKLIGSLLTRAVYPPKINGFHICIENRRGAEIKTYYNNQEQASYINFMSHYFKKLK